MDTPGIVEWMDLQLGPLVHKHHGKALIICDNCPSHVTPGTREALARHGVEVVFLPPNTTARLQVIDKVVNGPVKVGLRRNRCRDLFAEFQAWKKCCEYTMAHAPHGTPLPRFRISMPNTEFMATNLRVVINEMRKGTIPKAIETAFVSLGFVNGVTRTDVPEQERECFGDIDLSLAFAGISLETMEESDLFVLL